MTWMGVETYLMWIFRHNKGYKSSYLWVKSFKLHYFFRKVSSCETWTRLGAWFTSSLASTSISFFGFTQIGWTWSNKRDYNLLIDTFRYNLWYGIYAAICGITFPATFKLCFLKFHSQNLAFFSPCLQTSISFSFLVAEVPFFR